MKPLVTIYITNYNYAEYLPRAIESVLKQTFRDYELLIIDDGSTDNSREIIKKYEGHNNVFIIFQNNQGLNRTNNNALKLANGKYIIRLDADDFFEPRAIEVMANVLDNSPQYAMVFPDYYLVDERGNIIEEIRRHDFDHEVKLLDLPAHGACTMIRRGVLLDVGGYDESFICQDCYDIWLKIISKYKVTNINVPLFYYRQHERSLTKNESKILETRSVIKEKYIKSKQEKLPSVLAVIPIRGEIVNPKSIALKNLGEMALVNWTVDAALESKTVSNIVVTTPDKNIINHIESTYEKTVSIIHRTNEMARLNQPLEPTILDVLQTYSVNNPLPDLVVILFIESPFRSGMFIDEAVYTQQIYNVDVVDGIREENEIYYCHNGEGLQPLNLNSGLRLERENIYRRCGGIHLINRKFIETNKNMLSGRIGHILLDEKSAFTIRSELDWQIASILANKQTINRLSFKTTTKFNQKME
ncbi:MAG: glycosyltransferase [Bacteroidetes bacterium]|nr:glycosyltransferase [Bacteroidota bacterium]